MEEAAGGCIAMKTRRYALDTAGRILRAKHQDVKYVRSRHKYTFLCDGIKFEVKGSNLRYAWEQKPRFFFSIYKNVVPDYFLLLGFAEKTIMWIIPGSVINMYSTLAFSPGAWEAYRVTNEETLNDK